MSYDRMDFIESLRRVKLPPPDISAVVAAWGHGDGIGTDAGHYRWTESGVSDWSGGFLMRLRDGRFAYLTGWCDFTGWGCQDAATVTYFVECPPLEELPAASEDYGIKPPAGAEWDHEPADLNKWLADGAKDPDAA